ncbi:hypothetical protein BBP40_005853 [Aspergillus hancockii]|nr:hypothetical protein BBP40_005853 [Aspergillus hancockii]
MEQKSIDATPYPVLNRELTPRRFLIVVTAGGKTNATAIFEIARILHCRGHIIDFATLDGQQKWVNDYDFFSNVHILGPGQTTETEETAYLRMSQWRLGLFHSFGPIMDTKIYLESTWETVYPSLSALVQDPVSRPDFIIADYWVDAARDMQVENDIPIAMHWPQMPTNMLPASYIPGAAGLQVKVLTSEHASLWQRLQNYLILVRALPHIVRYRRWQRRMRVRMGVHRALPSRPKPDYLLLVNSFFGLEPAKDLPPNVAAIGPVLSDDFPGLSGKIEIFIQEHKRVLYISLGTHVLLPDRTLQCILDGATRTMQDGLVDGIIWAMRGMALKQFDLNARAPNALKGHTVADLVAGSHPHIFFTDFAPQRAVLNHPHTHIFLSHGGPASVNEALYHGVRLVTIGVYFDQLQNALRLRDAGVSIPLDKDTLDAEELHGALVTISRDTTGSFAQNRDRMKMIASIAARRKHLAADLIEETLADFEGRRGGPDCKRAMHLQTADMRMPGWRARNWDLWAIGACCVLVGLGIVLGVPVGVLA